MSSTIHKGLTPSERIERALDNPGPFSHNIIGCILRSVAEKEGYQAANALIDEHDLESEGYKKVDKP